MQVVTMGNVGRNYEHELSAGLADVTPPEVWVTTCGYSGNAGIDACDIVVTVDPQYALRGETRQFNIEAKKRQGESGKRVSNVFAGGEDGETGVEELQRFVEATPSWAKPVVALKFSRRKLVVLDGRWILAAVGVSKWPIPTDVKETIFSVLEPRATPTGNVSMIKPTTDAVLSARKAQDDEVVLAEQLGLPTVGDDDE